MLQALADNGRRREALQLSALQRGRHEVPVSGRRDIVDGEDHAGLDVRGHIFGGRRVHAGEVATVQLAEDVEVAGVRVRSGDGVEDADEFGLARFDGFDDFVDDRGVLVVKDLSGSAALDQSMAVRARDGDDVDSGGRGDLSCHGADGRGSAVHDESLADRRCRGLDSGIGETEGGSRDARHARGRLLDGKHTSGRLDGKGDDDAVGEGDVIGKESRLVGGDDRVQGVSAVRRATGDQVDAVADAGASSVSAKEKSQRNTYPMTRSPFLKRSTLEPTSYTSPATSQPKTVGHCWTKTPASCM